MALLPGFNKQYDDAETGCHTTNEAALQACRQAFFLKQQNLLIQKQQASEKLKDENTTLQAELETVKSELNALKTQSTQTQTYVPQRIIWDGSIVMIFVLILIVVVVATALITKVVIRK
jgi:hypothetical protein